MSGTHQATYLGMPAFPAAADASTRNTRLRANLRHATHTIRAKRATAVAELDDWSSLRAAGAAIKDRTLRHLDHYLEQLESAVTAAAWPRPLGRGRGRGEPDRHRAGAGDGRARGRQGQVDGHAGDRPERRARHRRDHGVRDRSRRADRAARRRPPVAHPGPGDPPQPGRDPRHLRGEDGPVGPPGPGAADRRARRPGGGRAAAPAREVPERQGGHLRRQLHDRGDRHARGRGVRGQRPDVPDPPRDADLRRRHREDRPHLPGPGGLPSAPAPLLDRRADEPVHLHLDRHHGRGRAPHLPPGPPRQRPHRHPRRHRGPPGAALHPLLGVSQCVPGVRTGGRPCLRIGVPGPDRRDPHPPTARCPERAGRFPPVRLLPVRGVLRGVPGRHRHPGDPGPPP